MATIKQLTKRVEVITRDMQKAVKRIEMHTQRTNKAFDKVNAAYGLNLSILNITETPVRMGNVTGYQYTLDAPTIDWADNCDIIHHWEHVREAGRDLQRATRELAAVNAELAKQNAAAAVASALETGTLAEALRKAVEPFRAAWFERMKTWHRKHYATIKEMTPNCRAKKARMDKVLNWWRYDRHHREAVRVLEQRVKKCAEVIMDKANRYDTLAGYMAYVDEQLQREWEACLVKLTNKCNKFKLDEAAIKTGAPLVTDKGFEIVITDGTNRRIYARIIWAAEYSALVTPHTRYIVTEKKTN